MATTDAVDTHGHTVQDVINQEDDFVGEAPAAATTTMPTGDEIRRAQDVTEVTAQIG